MGKLFGTDGIRGEANRYPMDAMTAFTSSSRKAAWRSLARALGSRASASGLARVVGYATAGVEPHRFGVGPVPAQPGDLPATRAPHAVRPQPVGLTVGGV